MTIPGTIDTELFLHGMYVAFVFAVLMFGALAFRQVLDDLEVRKIRLGEDRDAFVDAPGTLIMAALWILDLGLAIILYGIVEPSIYTYAMPMILAAQSMQISLRLYFQRTLVRTGGLVIRSVLFEQLRIVPFDDVVMIRFVRHAWWVTIRIGLPSREEGFRIFTASAPALERLLMASCSAPILWSGARDRHITHDRTT